MLRPCSFAAVRRIHFVRCLGCRGFFHRRCLHCLGLDLGTYGLLAGSRRCCRRLGLWSLCLLWLWLRFWWDRTLDLLLRILRTEHGCQLFLSWFCPAGCLPGLGYFLLRSLCPWGFCLGSLCLRSLRPGRVCFGRLLFRCLCLWGSCFFRA